MNWILITLGAIPIIYNVREGAKRKMTDDYHASNLKMTILLLASVVGALLIVFSGGSIVRNIVVLLVVSFVAAPLIAGLTTGRRDK